MTHFFHNVDGQTEIVFIEHLQGEDGDGRPAGQEVAEEKSEIRVAQRSEVPVVLVVPDAVGMEHADPIMILVRYASRG